MILYSNLYIYFNLQIFVIYIILIDYYKNELQNQSWVDFWDSKKFSLQKLIEKTETSLNEILAVPKKQDQTAILYCPACNKRWSTPLKRGKSRVLFV
jgi:hypothetical protein